MKILDGLRHRLTRDAAPADEPRAADSAEPPMPGYDELDHRQISARLHRLSQVDLTAVESYERSHADRPEVLQKLRYLRRPEPLPDYDALSVEQIATALADADTETIKGVRNYERRAGHRSAVMMEAARLLRTADVSEGEILAKQERDARVRDGIAGRQKTASALSDDGRSAT